MGSEVAGSSPAAAVLFRHGFLGAGGATALKLSRSITPTKKLITTKKCLRWLASGRARGCKPRRPGYYLPVTTGVHRYSGIPQNYWCHEKLATVVSASVWIDWWLRTQKNFHVLNVKKTQIQMFFLFFTFIQLKTHVSDPGHQKILMVNAAHYSILRVFATMKMRQRHMQPWGLLGIKTYSYK